MERRQSESVEMSKTKKCMSHCTRLCLPTWQCWMSSAKAWTTDPGPPLAPNRFSSSKASRAAWRKHVTLSMMTEIKL